MILKFDKFNESQSHNGHLLFYAFDWDDNILNMPTKIHMQNLVDGQWIPTDVSTAKFADIRSNVDSWRMLNNNPDEAFSEFRDFGPRGESAFLDDAKEAIAKGSLGPAWDDFMECLVNGSIFAIITARGHEAPAMRAAIEWIIDNQLSKEQAYEMYNNLKKFVYLYKNDIPHDRIMNGTPSKNPLVMAYLDQCDFVGVSSPSRGITSASNPEQAKVEALLSFNAKINKLASSIGMKAKVGFSDDDLKNVKHIEDLVDNLRQEEFPHIIHFVVKGTKDPKAITKKIRTFESTTPGMESSLLPFASFSNLSIESDKQSDGIMHGGSETRQDAFGNRLKKQVKFLTKEKVSRCGKNCRNCKCKNK